MEQRLDSMLNNSTTLMLDSGLALAIEQGTLASSTASVARAAAVAATTYLRRGRTGAVATLAGDTSITMLVRRVFELNPKGSFTAADVMNVCDLPKEKDATVRQALKRLSDDGFLLREREGVYQLNPMRIPVGSGG